MIEGVFTKKLTVHKDERGKLFEILRSDDVIFENFGQAYITVCNPGWVKGWHYHKQQKDYFCIIYGKAKVVLYDGRENSKTFNYVEEYILDSDNPEVLVIPENVIHGFECIGKEPCYILNIPTKPYSRESPDEFRLPIDSEKVPYQPWKSKKGW